MKRITKTFVIMLLVMMMSPLTAFAAPGFLEVELTPKNFNKYFELIKTKRLDEFGDYNGYQFILKSKLLSKGYYLYSAKDFAIKYTGVERIKQKIGNRINKWNSKIDRTMSDIRWEVDYPHDKSSNYKYAKISNFKIKKAKGKLVFIDPSNIVAVQDYCNSDNEVVGRKIILKQPYDKNTDCESHYDDNGNEVIDNYYYIAYDYYINYYNNGKDKILIR
jgi:hypothetical protein